jgi:hypothetical protein
MYRLCLYGPTGRIVKVRRYWANTDEGAIAKSREMLADDPTLIGFELWDGSRKVAGERRRAGVTPGSRGQEPAVRRPNTGPFRRRRHTGNGDKNPGS